MARWDSYTRPRAAPRSRRALEARRCLDAALDSVPNAQGLAWASLWQPEINDYEAEGRDGDDLALDPEA